MNPCPSFTQLQYYLDERLDGAEHRAVEAHAAGCPRCLDALQRAVERDLGSLCRSRDLNGKHTPGEAQVPLTDGGFLDRLKAAPRPAPDALPWHAGAPEAAAPLPALPGYEVLEVLGRGGMGVVYKAAHQGLQRVVALKMILAGGHADDADRARFRREAEAVARMRHPNIIQIHDIGEHEGRPYLALEYAEGGSLGKRLAGQPLPPHDAAALIEVLARAVHAAHRAGVVHRDLKPDNVLLTSGGREPPDSATSGGSRPPLAEYTPKVADFGLAKRLDQTGHTSTGAIVGTPGYMAPEQAGGESKQVGPAADVYGLGAILYQLLTGRPPFAAANALETLRQVQSEDPVPPRRLQPGTPRDLETVCLKCLAKEPAKRYATAEALADDLGLFLRGEPTVARPVGRVERVVKWARRRPALAGLVAVSALALAGYVVGSIVFLLHLNAANTNAQRQEGIARDALAAEQERGYYMRLALAQREIEKGQPTRAFELLAACPPEYRGWEWRYLHRLTTGGALFLLAGHAADITSVAVSPDGQLLATASHDHAVKLWNANTGAAIRALKGHGDGVSWVAFSPDSKRLASAGIDQTVRVWDVATGAELQVLGTGASLWASVAFSPDGRWLAGGGDGPIQVWDAPTGQERWTFKGHTKQVQALVFSPDSRWLASGSHDQTVKLWDLADGRERYTLNAHSGEVCSVAFSPDGQRLVSVSGSDSTLRIWDAASGAELSAVPWVWNPSAVAFSPDGRWLACGELSGKVTLRDARTGQVIQSWHAHGWIIYGLAFSPDGQRLVTCSTESAAVWDVRQGPDRLVLRGHARAVRGLVFSPDGQRLTTASFDGTLRQWDGHTGHLLRAWPAHANKVSHLAQSPDGKLLASASYDHTAKLWDAETGREVRTLTGHAGNVQAVAFSPDARLLATACSGADDRSVRLWDVATGQVVRILHSDKAGFWCVAFSPDGERLATGSVGGR